MTTKTILNAISEYYNVPLKDAKKIYFERENDGDLENVLEWYQNKQSGTEV